MAKIKQNESPKHYYMKFDVAAYDNEPKLDDCDAIAHGVYIKLLIALFRCSPKGKKLIKSDGIDKFASILLKQNVEQSNKHLLEHLSKICSCIAPYFARTLKFNIPEVEQGLYQLLENDVIYIDGYYLCQKKMVRDFKTSQERALAGAAGGKKTQLKLKEAAEKAISEKELLLKQKDKQNNQQNPNSDSNYNYNSIVEDKEVIDNMRGVQGEEKIGGKEEEPKIDHYVGNWELPTDVSNCKGYYFSHSYFNKPKELTLMALANFYETDVVEELEIRLKLWADEFVDFLQRTEPRKPMTGKNGFANHFHNWILSQNDRLRGLPDKRLKPTPKANGISTEDIDEKIKNETDPVKKQELRKQKYANP